MTANLMDFALTSDLLAAFGRDIGDVYAKVSLHELMKRAGVRW